MKIKIEDLICKNIYTMTHCRKGSAIVKIIDINKLTGWITIEIVNGDLTGLNDQWDNGETLSVIDSLCTFYEIK